MQTACMGVFEQRDRAPSAPRSREAILMGSVPGDVSPKPGRKTSVGLAQAREIAYAAQAGKTTGAVQAETHRERKRRYQRVFGRPMVLGNVLLALGLQDRTKQGGRP